MNFGLKKYIEIVKDLQKDSKALFIEDDSKKMIDALQAKLKIQFKQQITFDSTIVKAMLKRIDDQFRDYYYEESFVKTIEFLSKLTKLLRSEKFIGDRHVKQLESKIRCYEEDPCYVYFNFLCFLREATSRDEFRHDFLYKYMNMKDEEEYEDWDDEQYEQQYKIFFKKLFCLNPRPRLITYIYSCFCKFQDPKKMLSNDIIETINRFIGQDVGKTDIEIELNKELRALAYRNFYEHSSEDKQRISKEYDLIETLLNKFRGTKKIEELQLDLKLAKFGSLISGFAGTEADLDVTILTNSYVNENNFLQYLCDFLKIQFDQHDKKTGRKTKIQKIDATTPLVQVQIEDQRRQGKFKIDILVNNLLGVLNSKLLSVYAQIPWIKQLGILFKLWAKTNGVISNELLSSYATILLMLNFLIQKKYVNLIYNAKGRNANSLKINFKRMKNGYQKPDQFDVFYEFKTNPEAVTDLKTVNFIEILKELFLYYSEEGDHWKKNEGRNIISIDGSTEKEFENETVFTIKDPFDKPHNPGRAKIVTKNFFLDRFKQGFVALNQISRKPKKEVRESFLCNVFEKK